MTGGRVGVADGDAEDRKARHRDGPERIARESDAAAGLFDPRGGFHASSLAADP
jgi:hypothetical protein